VATFIVLKGGPVTAETADAEMPSIRTGGAAASCASSRQLREARIIVKAQPNLQISVILTFSPLSGCREFTNSRQQDGISHS